MESNENFIQVTLVRNDHQLHRYSIGNKTAKTEYQPDALIFRKDELQTLFYRVTETDFINGFKK